MSKDIDKIYQSMINDIEKEMVVLKDVYEENISLKKELEEQKKIIDSHQQILNIVLSNRSIRATGFLRKLQLHTFEMLKFLVNIFEKYDFDYWLDFGSLIGAYRHGGFIPWDDDIDTSMPRPDFEKFLKVLPKEIDRFEGLKDKVVVRKGSSVFKGAVLSENIKYSPIMQFYTKEPFAILEVYPSDFVNLSDSSPSTLHKYRQSFYKVRSTFKEDYVNGKCTFEEGILKGNKELGISDEKTEYMACSIDGAPRKPIHISKIYPLRKVYFEDIEMNIPHSPVEYLSAYYNEDVTRIPKKIHHHDTTSVVKRKLEGKDVDLYKLYDDTLEFWRNINDNF